MENFSENIKLLRSHVEVYGKLRPFCPNTVTSGSKKPTMGDITVPLSANYKQWMFKARLLIRQISLKVYFIVQS